MNPTTRLVLIAAGLAAAAGCPPGPPPAKGGGADVRMAFARALPPLDGQHLSLKLLEVSYGPGGSSRPHRHPCAVVGYVLEGALRIQVVGGPDTVYRAGESFYEAPNGVHQVSANASDRDSLRFLAWFTCDHEAPLSSEVASQ